MQAELWTRVRRVLDELLALPAERHAALIDARFAHDPEAADALRTLLDADASDPDFLTPPTLVSSDPAPAAESFAPGARFGAWRLVEPLGRGGMGSVWRAERADGAFQMQAALKLLAPGLGGDAWLRRFHAERQLLARLEHPSIARLIDGGSTEQGQPYLVMELVDGTPLDAHCAAHALSRAARVALLADVCDAVAHAHAALVVHRDIKPSNVLVTDAGVPKLLDFGIAGVLGDDAGDDAGGGSSGFALTPRYASPEQRRDEAVTTASDVYSLGVLAKELLGSAPPLSADLRAILERALQAEPATRYTSVHALADDLRRSLVGAPVSARDDSLGYRLRCLARRNPLPVALTALLFAVLVGAVIAVSEQSREAQASGARAERRFADVRDLANTLMFDLHDEIDALPGATRAREQLAQTALRYLDRLAAEAGDDRALLVDLSRGYLRMGDVQGRPTAESVGDPAAARASYTRLLELIARRRELGEVGDALRAEEALARGRLAAVQERQGEPEAALAQLAAMTALADGLRASPDPELAQLGVERWLEGAARRCSTLSRLGRNDEAVALAEQALPAARELAEHVGPAAPSARLLRVLLDELGTALTRMGRGEQAVERHAEATRLSVAARAVDPDSRTLQRDALLDALHLGDALLESGRAAEAIAFLERALALAEQRQREDPADAVAQRDLFSVHDNLARAHAGEAHALEDAGQDDVALERREDSLAHWERAQALADGAVTRRADDLEALRDALTATADVAGALWRLGRLLDSREQSERALELAAELLRRAPDDLAARHLEALTAFNMGVVAFQLGEPLQALHDARRFRAFVEPLAELDPEHQWVQRMTLVSASFLAEACLAAAGAHDAEALELVQDSERWYAEAERVFTELDGRGLLLPTDAAQMPAVHKGLEAARARLAELRSAP